MSDRNDGPPKTARPKHTTDYIVGYRKPPLATRFKAGHSGNPKGRPKKSNTFKSIIRDALTRKLVVREGERTRTISKVEGVVLRQIESALKGNDRAALATLKIAAQVGLLDEPASAPEAVQLTAAEQQIIDEALSRSAQKRSSPSSRNWKTTRSIRRKGRQKRTNQPRSS
jgi:hypothetical protein